MITNESQDDGLRDYLLQEVVIERGDVNQDGVFDVSDEFQYRRLLNLITLSKGARGSSLMISSAIIGLCDTNFKTDVANLAGQLSMNVEECTLDEFIEIMGIQTNKHNEIDNLRNLNVLAASMLINLIGKNVNATNYAEWKQRRIRSYSASLMLSGNDPNAIRVVLSLQYAMNFYADVRGYWQLRRRFFIEAWAL